MFSFSSKRVWIWLLFVSGVLTDLGGSPRPLRCSDLSVPWMENVDGAPGGNGTVLNIHVRPVRSRSRTQVFPGKLLFSFIRKIYRCCKEREEKCWRVKGIPGHLRTGTDVDFVFTPEILSEPVGKAELHVHLSNPQDLNLHPVLPFITKKDLPTRYRMESQEAMVELRVDLLLFIQTLQEAALSHGQSSSVANMRQTSLFIKGRQPKESPSTVTSGAKNTNPLPVVDLGLVLGCTQGKSRRPCGCNGVTLLHTPFIAIYYT